MILDTLANASRYEALHPLFAHAFQFFAATDFATLPSGPHAIAGSDLMVTVIRGANSGSDGATLEAHRRHIDIHVTLQGADSIGWKPEADCVDIARDYDEAGDSILFRDSPDQYIAVPPETFVVLFPEDAHAALCGSGPIEKIVFKIICE